MEVTPLFFSDCVYFNVLYIYIYIYIYTVITRLLRCITTLQCNETRKMLRGGIKTGLTLRQLDILPLSYRHSQHKLRNFFVYLLKYTLLAIYIYIYIYIYIFANE